MDSVDLKIVKLFFQNCRISYREISEKNHISLNVVYKRVQKMIDSGLIANFTAKPSNSYLKTINILIYGKFTVKNPKKMIKEIIRDEHVHFVGLATNNTVLVEAILRDTSEMHAYTEFVINTAKMFQPFIGIKKIPNKMTSGDLYKTDYRILNTIYNEARMSFKEISGKIGISTKTVKKRIQTMLDENLVDFSIDFAPHLEGMIISNFNIRINSERKSDQEYQKILQNFEENILYLQQFSNKPKNIMLTTIVKSNSELSELYSKLQDINYSEIEQLVIFHGEFNKTWRDRLFQKKLEEL
ncbi:winged helix-turn-helix transcriptional regulator [Candidatus Lokiarchaeum ossiferum]|uniref:winged helix-turn-helix transcriptional regulator n=1 Tax=Candidatus Lokiarchaeum ossiferum TaxID=2951803 RepID=UPI00352E2658